MFTTIIFDFAGVVGARLTQNFAQLLHIELGILPEKTVHAWEAKNQLLDAGAVPENEFWDYFRNLAGIPPTYPAEQKFLSCVQLNQPMIELMRRLKKDGYVVGLLSNIGPTAGRKMRQMNELCELLDVMVLSRDVGMVKPEKVKEKYAEQELAIYAVLEKKLKEKHPETKRSEILFIDDKEGPCASANVYGIAAIRYEYDMERLEKALRENGIRI